MLTAREPWKRSEKRAKGPFESNLDHEYLSKIDSFMQPPEPGIEPFLILTDTRELNSSQTDAF
ncbi:hypothetical protein SK3146_02003 [Paenibacillus konkukensis]|uniref:Uncharacterized protein n=1 Tax=Paenibacillus konkukensis TaxID=2020716 RepID=A0ABY4RMR2_9BACL|nr:hypothetical protein SK3146_02003 [Paenibacillus konkukensis]